jgi:hypothetical protein
VGLQVFLKVLERMRFEIQYLLGKVSQILSSSYYNNTLEASQILRKMAASERGRQDDQS